MKTNKEVKVGSRVIVDRAKRIKAEVLAISSKIKIKREDKEAPVYIYEDAIIDVVSERGFQKHQNIKSPSKYIEAVLMMLKEKNLSIFEMCKEITCVNKQGHIYYSQLEPTLRYLIATNRVNKVGTKYCLVDLDEKYDYIISMYENKEN